MRKKLTFLIVCGLFFLITGCSQKNQITMPKQTTSDFVKTTNYSNYSRQQKKLAKFIETKMETKQGIYTNYRQQKYVASEARGHELLSESSGLWLEYLVETHQYAKFRSFYRATKKTFDQGDQFSYRYTPKTKKKFNVNATLDDLRIINALQKYADLTGNSKYRKEAATRFANLKKNTMTKGKIASFYDVKAHKASSEGFLPYYDLQTLRYFESATAADKKMYHQQLAVVKAGYLGDAFPLYANSYNWQNQAYSTTDLNTSEALETILHLAEVGKVKQVTLNWLQRQVENNTLYNAYSVNGSVMSQNHSAGSYALAAEIFAVEKDPKMYYKAMTLAWEYQIPDKSSPLYGAIGIEHKKEAYSYNNLTTLVATQY